MSFLKILLFSQASPLIKLAKSKHLEESDMLALPNEVNPRTIPVPVTAIRWDSPRSLLMSLIKVQRRFVVPGYFWY